MKSLKLIFFIITGLVCLSQYAIADIREVTIKNMNTNYYLTNAREIYPIHGTWDEQVDSKQEFHYNSVARTKMSSHGNGIQGWLVFDIYYEKTREFAGYLEIEINNYMAHFNLKSMWWAGTENFVVDCTSNTEMLTAFQINEGDSISQQIMHKLAR